MVNAYLVLFVAWVCCVIALCLADHMGERLVDLTGRKNGLRIGLCMLAFLQLLFGFDLVANIACGYQQHVSVAAVPDAPVMSEFSYNAFPQLAGKRNAYCYCC